MHHTNTVRRFIIAGCLWRIDTVAVKRSDPRNALQLRTSKLQMISFEVFAEVDRTPQRARVFDKSGSHWCLI